MAEERHCRDVVGCTVCREPLTILAAVRDVIITEYISKHFLLGINHVTLLSEWDVRETDQTVLW
jgi:hypothetical protein